MRFQKRKFKELVLYISAKCQEHEFFGKVKLNKLLFFSDFTAFRRRGLSITGANYQKLKMGPSPRLMPSILDEMIANAELAIIRKKCYDRIQHRPTPLRESNLEFFEAWEIDIVNDMIVKYKDQTADEISNRSHKFIGYELASLKEDIPYSTVYCREQEPSDITPEIIKIAVALERQA
ncbi:MAG: Panacea domain-containing protein [candidate division Zixibacteria bacterium]|nr:Panacea domain-containing protein [candidate division Zixibacteria bacterium]